MINNGRSEKIRSRDYLMTRIYHLFFVDERYILLKRLKENRGLLLSFVQSHLACLRCTFIPVIFPEYNT